MTEPYCRLLLSSMNGRFWTNEDGRRVLEGSVSAYHTDEVMFHLRGSWLYDDMRMCPMCGVGHGVFHGKIFRTNDRAIGEFHGEFGDWSLPQ